MSEIKVNSIKGVGASTAAITVNNSDGTCTANITNNLSNRNLIINGAMQVAQRGTSTSTSSDFAADRFKFSFGGTDESPTMEQVDVASGTTPYTLGFQKALRVTNGNQTSGAGAGDFIEFYQYLEDQDISNSGWNFKSATSFLTISFWVKSSVAQKFTGFFYTNQAGAGDSYMYSYQIDNGSGGNLTADTWTKVTHSIPGMSSLTFNNDNTNGLAVGFYMFEGTDYSTSGHTENTWAAWNSSNKIKDMTSTWYTTNNATFEITGVQLEVGSVATDFEHRSFAQELKLCERYFEIVSKDNAYIAIAMCYSSTVATGVVQCRTTKRTSPSIYQIAGTNNYIFYRNDGNQTFNSFSGLAGIHRNGCAFYNNNLSHTSGHAGGFHGNNANAFVALQAEL